MQAVKKAASIVLSVIMWIIILVAALYAFTTLATREDGSVSDIAGFTPLAVQSESMSPTFNKGDLIFIQKCDTSKLEVGDIVTFHTIIDNEYALNTHRIESIDELNGMRSFTTKGDNNDVADTHVISDGDIVGKYLFAIPQMGKVMDFLSSSMGFLIVIVLPMLLFFIYQVYHLVVVGMNLKRAMAEEDRIAAAKAIVDAEKGSTAAAAASAAAVATEGVAATAAASADATGAVEPAPAAEPAAAETAAEPAATDATEPAADDAAAKLAEAEAKLEEARRLKAEAEAALAGAEDAKAAQENGAGDAKAAEDKSAE